MSSYIRILVAALVVGVIAFTFLILWMHASVFFGLALAAILGVLVLAISGPGSEADRVADEAWLAAAPDLPPHSERVAMERDQETLGAPQANGRRAGGGAGETVVQPTVVATSPAPADRPAEAVDPARADAPIAAAAAAPAETEASARVPESDAKPL